MIKNKYFILICLMLFSIISFSSFSEEKIKEGMGTENIEKTSNPTLFEMVFDYGNFLKPSEMIVLQKKLEELYKETKVAIIFVTRKQADKTINFEGSIVKHFSNVKQKFIIIIRTDESHYRYILSPSYNTNDNIKLNKFFLTVQNKIFKNDYKSYSEEFNGFVDILLKNAQLTHDVSYSQVGLETRASSVMGVLIPVVIIAIILMMLFAIFYTGYNLINSKKNRYN